MKKIIAALLVLSVVTIPAFATDAETAPNTRVTERPEHKQTDMAQRYEENLAKWAELSDKQRKSVYDIQDKMDKLAKQMAERYYELGLLTQEEAAKFAEHIDKRAEQVKTENLMPGMKKVEPHPQRKIIDQTPSPTVKNPE